MRLSKFLQIENISFIFVSFFPVSIIIGQAAISINYLILTICFFFLLYLEQFRSLLKKYIFYIFPFFLIIIFSSIINLDRYDNHSIEKSFFYLKNFFLFFVLIFILRKTNHRKFFYFVIIGCCVFVAIDNFIQFFFGKDILGYSKARFRLTGPFGDNEYVSGSYLAKFSVLIFPFLFIGNQFIKKYFSIIFIFFIFTSIVISGERASTLIFVIASLCFYFLKEKKIKNILILLSFFILTLFSLFKFDNSTKYKFFQTTYQIGLLKYIENIINLPTDHSYSEFRNFEDRSFLDSNHGAHFITAFEIWKNNKLFGIGLKNFSKECKNHEYSDINSKAVENRCTSHPHNFYLELLSEFGFVGFILFAIIIFKIYFEYQKSLFKNNIFLKASLSELIAVLWPLISTGSIISNFNGSFIWINLALFISICEYDFKYE